MVYITTNQQWISYTGFTSVPTTRYFSYTKSDNLMFLQMYYAGFGVAELGGEHSFTVPLPIPAMDPESMIMGGDLILNFNPTLAILTRNAMVIPHSPVPQDQNLVITIPNIINNPNGNCLLAKLTYSLGSPYTN